MSYYSKKDHSFVRFQKSKTKHKKYDAIIKNKKTGKEIKIPFGDSRFEHFKDSTGLGLYSYLNHGDKDRRSNYKKRHSVYIKPNMYSAGYFSNRYLW